MDSPKRARSRKRRILPRVALKVAEPVLYSTATHVLRRSRKFIRG